jgi:hypothetical protein
MKRYLLLTFFLAFGQLTSAQYYVRGDHNGWGLSNQLVHRSGLGGGTYSTLFQAGFDQEFKIANQDWSNQWGSGYHITVYNARWTILAGGSNAIWKGGIMAYTQVNTENPDNYIGQALPCGILTLSAYPVSVNSVSQVGMDAGGGNYKVSSTQQQTVNITLSGAKSAEEYVYLRYTIDGWTNTSWVLASGSGTSYTAVIPGQSNGTTVNYYVLTSTLEHSNGNHLDLYPDLMTLNYNTNSGDNWEYTVEIGFSLSIQDLNAKKHDENVLLSWTSLNESNISHYEIERSADGIKFEPSGRVDAKGLRHDSQNYIYTDEKPYRGNSFYRIKAIGPDGAYNYSSIVSVFVPQQKMDFVIFPVLASEQIRIEFSNQSAIGSIMIYDPHGRNIRTYSIENGISGFDIGIVDLKKGMYVIRYTDGTSSVSRKFFRI